MKKNNKVKNKPWLCWPTLKDEFKCLTNISKLRLVRQIPVVVYSTESIFEYDYRCKYEAKFEEKFCIRAGALW